MKTKFFTGLLMFVAVFLSNSASAVPVIMAFENLGANQDTPYIENGFSIEAPGEHLHATFSFTNGSLAAQMAADTEGTRLTRVHTVDSESFFDMHNLWAENVSGNDAVIRSGFAVQIDGLVNGVVQASKQLTTGTTGLINFAGAEWLGLNEVQFWYQSQGAFGNPSAFAGDDFKFDNITVEPTTVSNVPVPAAVWLFFSALGGLGILRRKQVAA